jgi:hypothetical protein
MGVQRMMIPADVYKEFIRTGTIWSESHCEASQLEDQLKPMLSSLTLAAKETEGVNSMAEAKEIAQSSSVYRDAIRHANTARKEANIAKVVYSATSSLFDAQRTAEASERAATRAAT